MSIPRGEKQAARAALRAINPLSIRQNVEYGVVIYRKGKTYGAPTGELVIFDRGAAPGSFPRERL